MKALLGIFGLLAVLGILYGLAFVGVLPTQKLAAKSPTLGKALIALHLAKPPAHRKTIAAAQIASTPSPEQKSLDAEKQELDSERAQLDKDKADLAAQQQAAANPAPEANPAPAPDTGAKLIALYGTMDPDDIAHIFAKLPDPMVVQTLMQLDEKKAGKVFAVLPPDRAARLSELMNSRSAARPASAAAAPAPASVVQ